MTREEEIKQIAEKKAFEPSKLMHPFAKQHKTMSAYEIGFIEGACWADRTMIDKACEWLEKTYQMTPNGGYYYLEKDCIEQFRKAMEGGEQ